MPNTPTFVCALLASDANEGAEEIAALHDSIIQHARDAGINIISMAADGAATELSAQAKLRNLATHTHTYSKSSLKVHVKIPLLGNPPRPLVTLQDPKHARKTAANQLLSGARLITMGRFVVCIQQLAHILQLPNSPLLARDVFDCDKQDDGRAYQTFSSQTILASLSQDECTGLSVYLFVFGEMCDAWLNKSMCHKERICSAWMAAFFLRRWEAHLLKRQDQTNSLMSFHLNCISHPSFKIFSTLAHDLLALIISHRDFYPDFPFLPWKHRTEACEHIFGWMRVISSHFSVLDARLMMPKIYLVVKCVVEGKIKMGPSEHMHSGYQHAFSDENGLDSLEYLRKYPSNSEISHQLVIASQRANSLAHFCGMGPLEPEDDEVLLDKISSNTESTLDGSSTGTHPTYELGKRFSDHT